MLLARARGVLLESFAQGLIDVARLVLGEAAVLLLAWRGESLRSWQWAEGLTALVVVWAELLEFVLLHRMGDGGNVLSIQKF